MRYKQKVRSSLEGIENKLGVLVNVVEGNKPMSRDHLILALKEIQKDMQRNVELIDLEVDEMLLRNSPNLV